MTAERIPVLGEMVDRDGWLYFLDAWQADWRRPVSFRLAWPTGIRTAAEPHLVGQPIRRQLPGMVETESGVTIALLHGPKTTPDDRYCEERRKVKPRWAHEYRNGRWAR